MAPKRQTAKPTGKAKKARKAVKKAVASTRKAMPRRGGTKRY